MSQTVIGLVDSMDSRSDTDSAYSARSLVGQRERSKHVRFVQSSPLRLQKRLRLRKSELDKKTILFFETCISRGSFQSRSGIGPQINTGPEDSSTEDKSVIFWDTDVSLQISLPSLFSIR
jgi:hypothetical protein